VKVHVKVLERPRLGDSVIEEELVGVVDETAGLLDNHLHAWRRRRRRRRRREGEEEQRSRGRGGGGGGMREGGEGGGRGEGGRQDKVSC
jgi:hypothetical protein